MQQKKKFKGFQTGFKNFFKAIPFIINNKLWWTFFIPIALNLILYLSGFALMDTLGNLLETKIDAWLSPETGTWFMENLPGILAGIAKFVIQIAFFFIFAYFSGFILLILLSPLFAWLSERTDQILNKTNYPFNFGQFIRDIWRGISIALRNMLYETGIMILVFIASFIPLLNIITAPLGAFFMFIVSSYFYGFSYMDYTNERVRLRVKESILLIRKYRGMAIANGALFSIALLIPFLGGLIAIVATVGATLSMNEIPEIRERTKNYQTNL
jgi:CysZ protein